MRENPTSISDSIKRTKEGNIDVIWEIVPLYQHVNRQSLNARNQIRILSNGEANDLYVM